MKLIINIDLTRKEAKPFLDFFKQLDFIQVSIPEDKPAPNNYLKQAIAEAETGQTTKLDGSDPLSKYLQSLLS